MLRLGAFARSAEFLNIDLVFVKMDTKVTGISKESLDSSN